MLGKEGLEAKMSSQTAERLSGATMHAHNHGQNRFAVIPTHQRLNTDTNYTGRGVTIAFLDSGFYPHPDLTEPASRIVAFHDISGQETSLRADRLSEAWQWHGTQTSVVAAGNGRLSDGIYRGLAHDAQLVLVKVSDRGRISEENIARGIEWVIENRQRYRIRVLNISLGGDEDVPCSGSIVDLAAEEAIRRGIVVVAAAGNNGLAEKHSSVPPANSPSVITVGGYDDHNQEEERQLELYSSNYGATADGTIKPELLAPAMWIATPILPGTSAYTAAESLSLIAAAPDYRLRSLARSLGQQAELPESLLQAEPDTIRAEVESLLSRNKTIATHYQHGDGTSFAAPIVSSVVAQMLEANPNLSPAAVKSILISTADRIKSAPVIRQGYGCLNARRAVSAALLEQHALNDESFSPLRIEGGKLVFLYHDDAAEVVALVGDFNKWNPAGTLFTKAANGIWRAEIALPPKGRYSYKLIVDGARWLDDPNNWLKEPDSYGGFNSVVNIT
jgi:serine protease AprX